MEDELQDIALVKDVELTSWQRLRLLNAFAAEHPESYNLWFNHQKSPEAFGLDPTPQYHRDFIRFLTARFEWDTPIFSHVFVQMRAEMRVRVGRSPKREQVMPSDEEMQDYGRVTAIEQSIDVSLTASIDDIRACIDYCSEELKGIKTACQKADSSAHSSEAVYYASVFRVLNQFADQLAAAKERPGWVSRYEHRDTSWGAKRATDSEH